MTISSRVTSIGDGAFSDCDSLTAIQVVANNQRYCSVDGIVFSKDMKDMKTLVAFPAGKQGVYSIPSSVTSIGDSAFGGCSDLTSVTIPNSVTNIGVWAFAACDSLSDVYYGGSEVQWKTI